MWTLISLISFCIIGKYSSRREAEAAQFNLRQRGIPTIIR